MDDAVAIERRVLDHVAALGVACERLPCDPEAADTATFCLRYGVAPEDSANTIVVAAKQDPRRYVACVLLATTRLDVNRAVCRFLGVRRASFADADETRAVTGMLIGGVTPFGLPGALPVLVDARVLDRPRVVVGGGSRSLKLRIDPAGLARLPSATVVDGLAVLRDASPAGMRERDQ
jgi:prolyl-tRNA editing enzyme YbaK/EbsC (Cys-tRNA(Pro) deacylase)